MIRSGGSASSSVAGSLYRQQCPHLQADWVPTSTAGAAPLFKEVLAMGASPLFLIFVATGDVTTEVEGKKMEATLWGPREQFIEATPSGDCCAFVPFYTRALSHLRWNTETDG